MQKTKEKEERERETKISQIILLFYCTVRIVSVYFEGICIFIHMILGELDHVCIFWNSTEKKQTQYFDIKMWKKKTNAARLVRQEPLDVYICTHSITYNDVILYVSYLDLIVSHKMCCYILSTFGEYQKITFRMQLELNRTPQKFIYTSQHWHTYTNWNKFNKNLYFQYM